LAAHVWGTFRCGRHARPRRYTFARSKTVCYIAAPKQLSGEVIYPIVKAAILK
jgi:hypothetical protein